MTSEQYVVPGHVMAAASAGGTVVLNSDTGEYHFLNGTGEHVFNGLRDGKAIEEVVAQLAEKHGLDVERASADCRIFLSDMVERGLLLTT